MSSINSQYTNKWSTTCTCSNTKYYQYYFWLRHVHIRITNTSKLIIYVVLVSIYIPAASEAFSFALNHILFLSYIVVQVLRTLDHIYTMQTNKRASFATHVYVGMPYQYSYYYVCGSVLDISHVLLLVIPCCWAGVKRGGGRSPEKNSK